MNRLFEPDGKVRAPLNAPAAIPAEKPTSAAPVSEPRKLSKPAMAADDGWGDAAATLIYRGVCLVAGAGLCGAGLILGGWAALKALPLLESVLTGQSGQP
jgi:hypothetical protein